MKPILNQYANKSLSISRLMLSNYRCFRNLEINFHERLTVLVANNGQGKTAILDAIATAFGPFLSAFDEGKDRAFSQDDIHLLRSDSSNRMEHSDGGVTLEATGMVGYESATWKRQLAGLKARTTRVDAKVLTNFGKTLQSQVRRELDGPTTGTRLPLLAYYPTDRLWNIRRLPSKKLSRTSRMVGYTHCLESGSDFHLMADWFRYWSVTSLNQRLEAQQSGELSVPSEFDNALEVVRNSINLCLKPSGWGNLAFSIKREEIVAHHPQHGELPVAMLSDGIRNMLTMVADIAFRMVKLNPNLGPYAASDTDGIVLIDEVDMHLHPAWQQSVLLSLQEAFPRIQFIVTTHSPQVLTSVDSSCIRAIEDTIDPDTEKSRTEVKSGFAQTKGVTSTDLLFRIMGVNPIPPVEEAAWVAEYITMIDNGVHEGTEGQSLRKKLENFFGPTHPVLLDADRLIRFQTFKLRKSAPAS